jgi:seryl-tRNA synthetase
MVLDITLFREDKSGPEALAMVRESQRRRNPADHAAADAAVDAVLAHDKSWRTSRYALDQIATDVNALNKQLKDIKLGARKAAADGSPLPDPSGEKEANIKAGKKELDARKAELEAELAEAETQRGKALAAIGNLVHESVPVHHDEDVGNTVERVWAEGGDVTLTPESAGTKLNHVDLLHMIDGVEYERGVKVCGNRGYFLKGPGVLLNMAIIQRGLSFMTQRGYTPVQTPMFMEKQQMAKCAQLDDFDEQLYKVTGEGEDKYLIATSEQPLCVYHADEWIPEAELPRKFIGHSTCFRKEAGSHGRDQLGIFRVHQFEKLEQFVITCPDNGASYRMLDEMIENAEQFYKDLKLPYRVVNICSGALNDAAAKKFDLEAWFPSSGAYRELVSCSNCLDYQSRKLEARCGIKKMGDTNKRYVHMLNSTLCATSRVICCILENYQDDAGVKVPEVLQPFMGGMTHIPFVRDAPKLKVPKKK